MTEDQQRQHSFEKELRLDPKSRVFVELGEMYRTQGLYEKAIAVLTRGLSYHPLLSPARLSLGRTYFENGQPDQAQEQLEEFLDVVPEHLLANKMLAKIYLSKSMMEEAQDCIAQILLVDPHDRFARRQMQGMKPRFEQEDEPVFEPKTSEASMSKTMQQIYQAQREFDDEAETEPKIELDFGPRDFSRGPSIEDSVDSDPAFELERLLQKIRSRRRNVV
ncbi:MAG: tetratricopeptide repeat protein [Bdellovibrionota bacterium]